jgi:hypothetical protein
MPSAKMNSANAPATGLRASAACAEESMWVLPDACKVAAVVMMMAIAIKFDTAMPTSVSMGMRFISLGGLWGSRVRGFLSGSIR